MRSVKNQVKDSALEETLTAVDRNARVVASQNYKNGRLFSEYFVIWPTNYITALFRSSHMYYKKEKIHLKSFSHAELLCLLRYFQKFFCFLCSCPGFLEDPAYVTCK